MLQKLTTGLLFGLVFLLSTGFNNPETVVFSADKSQFLSELRDFMHATNNKEHISLFDKFEKQVRDNEFTDVEFSEIVKICNKMGEVRMKAAPYYVDYLKGLNVVKYQPIGKDNFMDWHETLEFFLKDLKQTNFRKYSRYLTFSQKLFSGLELHRAKGGIDWSASGPTPAVMWEADQPVIKYLKTDLRAIKKDIGMSIKGTSGVFYPLENKWVGQGGVVSWTRVSENIKATAELSTYEVDMNKGSYTAENAQLSYPKYFSTAKVSGRLEDKLISTGRGRKSSYPRFASTKEAVTLNVAEGFVYTGGFKMQGAKVEGYAEEGEVCSLTHRNQAGELTYRLAGDYFSLNDEKFINAKNVEAVLYFGQDSIFHPCINSKTDLQDAVLTLRTGEKAISKAPFYDSYHQMYINTDKLNWYPLEKKLMINETRIKAGTGSQTITVESQDFYDEKYLRRLQNVADYNPVVRLMLLAEKEGNTIAADKVAKQMNPNFEVANIQSLLFDLEENGFIRFLPKEKIVKVYDKVFRYAEAHAGKRDYDILKIKSDIGGGNAEMDLEKREMTLKGVKSVEFSNRQRVAATPTGKKLTVGENRKIDYDGLTYAGFATLQGEGFHFDYDKFWLKADSVRYLDFFLPESNGDAFAIGSRIEHVSGTLLIDAPANKSGLEDLTLFPAFKSSGKSYVYYDQNNKLGDAYPREEFYFELDPFYFEELRKLTPEHFELKGRMVTAGIFPVFEETLRLQEDLSLGFSTTVPAEGYGVFEEKGNFKGEMIISNEGLRGKGALTYQKTDIQSDDIVFRTDKMTCSAEGFNLEEDKNLGLPKVNGQDVKIDWKPYADSMYIQSKEKSFDVFTTTKHSIAGGLIYTPGGLKGNGTFKWDEGTMDSNLFDFGHFSVEADTTNLQINALETDALAFDTKNVAGVMDFENQIGNFKANDKESITEMPYNEYKTTLNEFEWNLGKKNITFIAPPNQKGVFTSTDKHQKELAFEGESAMYDFNSSQLQVGGVSEIKTADAFVYPNEGKVTILPGGKMEELQNASILAGRENKYHKITGATVQVHGKDKYTGSGFYEYNVGTVEQEIPFSSIVGQRVGKRTDNKIETVAEATVGADKPFLIGQGFEYEGQINLRSSSPDLGYHGFARFKSDIFANPRWFSVNCRADKNDLKLQLDTPEDKEEQHVHTGLFFNQEARHSYSRLMMPLESRKDHAFIEAAGMVRYDATKGQYLIGDSLKVVNPDVAGNLVIFNEKDATLTAKGTIDMTPNLKGPAIKVAGVLNGGLPAGELTKAELGTEEMSADVAAAFTFGLPDDLKEMIFTDFESASFEANSVVYNDRETYKAVMPELVSDAKKLPQTMQQLTKGYTFSIPAEDCTFDFLLTELELAWNADNQAFMSSTKQFGLAALQTKGYHKMIDGIVEFKVTADGQAQPTVLLTSPSGNWYFFSFKNGILSTVSSYEQYNIEVEGLKAKDKTVKLESGSFDIELATPAMVANCRSRASMLKK